MPRRLLAALCLFAFAPAPALAHDGPSAEIAVLDVELKNRPNDVDLLLQRAALHRRLGNLASALADLARAESVAPARREIYLERGLIRQEQGDAAGAEADFSRYLDAGPPSALALEGRAQIREASRRFSLARADYDAALKLRGSADLYLARGRMDEAEGKLDRAAAGYEEGLRALSGAVTLRIALVRVEIARKHAERAVELVDEAMASAPLKADWLLLRADAHAAAGRHGAALRDRESALRELDETLARRPNDLARTTRARALLALGRAVEAKKELEGVVARSSRLEEAQKLLAEARRRAGGK
ncbi:tetratricopeptide repeat protein [Polyangium aurulentum]|uniref:tetratricopeptide repeat protein n=1 Tax=Polyangium aurulentum TaxID=2567896 RepID=UPI00146D35EB|nr:tetratricopeptide repeat protein [Polyangium aurulentum]UQA55491.1 tetratricopeptide repeat protein [Polyangium aurulentum]